nr:hypothetical protein [Morganella morganii]
MPNKIFSPKYNPVERVAFDMALALASKIESVNTPAQLMAEIAALYPECYKALRDPLIISPKRNHV